MTTSLQAAILDLDGTLIDSNDAHARAWVTSLKRHGFDIPFERVRPLIGMGGDKLIPELTGLDPESETGKALTQGWGDAFKPMIPSLQATPGARELVAGLRELGWKLMLGSSGEDEVVEQELEHLGLEDLKNSRVTSSEVEESKPDADILAVALRKLGVPAGAALMVGDTKYDAEAARRAGVRCVLLRCGGNPDLPGEVYASPADLLGALRSGDWGR
ncbi:HAD family hydrolase [Deinococcus irradiatisoli]|uniref:HAD family hydrolase n=1 Tax=Deinococcus irradiatisoli TaxID=2202254 RepID=A0A2Z3JHP9_9DEIO|nr:HAD family hydrolase [Deinococcus irradiatisoli]AWN23101.1 HAD family hydrolase [Deinococcus irradiatisoli]